MPTKILAALLAVGLAACGAGEPDKVEEPLGADYTCSENRTDPRYRPPSGCSCKPAWSYVGVTICGGRCATPDDDAGGPWCYTTATCMGKSWAYCTVDP